MKHIKYLLLVLAMFVVSTDGFSRNGGDRLAVSVSHDGNSMYFMKSKKFTGEVSAVQSNLKNQGRKASTVTKGVWYAKPEGTFYKNGYPTASLVVPPFTELAFTNQCTNIEASSWSVNGETFSQGTPTFLATYPALRETASFPVPQISVAADTFALGRTTSGKVFVDGNVATKEAIDNLTKTDYVLGGSYVGWADFPGFPFKGSRDLDGDGVKEDFEFHTLVQHYQKPAVPFYLTSLLIPFSSYQTAKDMVPEGKEITVRIDKTTYGNTIATGRITKTDIDLSSWIEDPKENVTYASPVVSFDEGALLLDDEFFIVVEGLEECEQMGFWVTLPELYEQETEEFRTRTEGYDKEGQLQQTSWSYVDGKNTSYWEAVIYLKGMFDVAQIDTSLVEMTAPARGGIVTATYAQGEEVVEDSALIFRSSRPYYLGDSDEATYYVENTDESSSWLNIKLIEDTDDKLTRITFEAEPLNDPAPEGRQVSVRIRGVYGACTESVTVRQFPMDGDSFTFATDEGNNITFTIVDSEAGTCEINDMDIDESGTIVIPDSISVYRVLGIADGAFAGHDNLTEVSISFSDSLGGKIGKELFKDCLSLEKITIGENVSELSDSAFVDCPNINTVVSLVDQDDLWVLNPHVFDASVYENATLIVPESRVEQYQTTEGWNNFQTIMDPETALDINMPNATTNANVTNIYMLDGRRTDKVRSGVNIIRKSDGSVRKLSTK